MKFGLSESNFSWLFNNFNVNIMLLGLIVEKRNWRILILLNGVADMHLYDVKDDDICVFTDIYEYLMTMDASNAENRGENSIYYQMY